MKHVLSVSFFLLFLQFLSLSNFAQQSGYNISFQHLTTDKGLPSNITYSLTQDSAGFIWIATSDGLARYDGYNTKVFRRSDQSNSIRDNFIYDVFVDIKSNIWIGTNYRGLYLYNPVKEDFIKIDIPLAGHDNAPLGTIRKIRQDSSGMLWLCTQSNGVILFNPDTYASEHLYYDNTNQNSIASDEVIDVGFDIAGNTWLAHRDSGITILNADRELIGNFKHTPYSKYKLPNNSINTIYTTPEGITFVGTRNSACYFNISDSTFNTLTNSETFSFHYNRQNQLFIGSSDGIYVLKGTEKVNHYRHIPTNSNSLTNNLIRHCYEDNSGVMWFCTRAGGVNYFYPKKKMFQVYRHNSSDKHSLSHNLIRSFSHDAAGNLWVGTVQNGIDILSAEDGKFYNIFNGSFQGLHFRSNSIVKLYSDKSKNMWIGTWGDGVFLLKRGTSEFIPISKGKTSSDIILDIFEDSQGNIWIGTENGLDIYNPESKAFRQFVYDDNDTNSIAPFGIQSNCIVEDIHGDFWVGSYGGLSHFSRRNVSDSIFNDEFNIRKYSSESPDSTRLSENRIISLNYNGEVYPNKLMVGTYGGGLQVVLFDKQGVEVIKSYTTYNGLSNNVIYASQTDKSGNIWMSTSYGLTKFDAENYVFKTYGLNDGLQDYQFFWGASLIDTAGYFYFGGVSGYNKFHPDSILDDKFIPPVVFTEFRIYNKPVSVGEELNNRIILTESINSIDKIKLTHKESMFSISFSSLHYAFSEDNLYEYMLEGFDKEFIRVGHDQRIATYTNLDAGTYTFMVKGSNFDGAWNPELKTLTIKIIPPFRKTIFFRILVILLAVIFTGSFFLFRMAQIRHMGIVLKQSVEDKTFELNASNQLLKEQAHELQTTNDQLLERTTELHDINALLEARQQKVEEQSEELRIQAETLRDTNTELELANAAKDKFFSILSHDLKNPFNYILGSSEILFRQFQKLSDEKKLSYSRRIYTTAESTYALLENLLTWSRTQRKKIIPEPIKLKVFDVIDQSIQILEGRMKSKEITLESDIDKNLTVFFDNNMIHAVVRNILTNAVKFTRRKGKIKILAEEAGPNTTIRFSDDGIGMSKEKLASLFLIDKTVSVVGTEGETGTGLGLILSNEFVLANNGTLKIESEENEGTTVILTVPSK